MKTLFPYLKVEIEELAYQKIMDFVSANKGECSGLGKVKRDGNKFLIYDVVIPKQRNGGAFTELDVEDLCEIANKLAMEGKDTADWHVWFHSHADFGVFYSATDNDTIEGYMEFFSPENSYLISIVVNHRKDMICRLDTNYPLRMVISDIQCEVKRPKVWLLPPISIDKDKVYTMIKNSKGYYSVKGASILRMPVDDTFDIIMKGGTNGNN